MPTAVAQLGIHEIVTPTPLWALILGFTLSAIVEAVVSKGEMSRLLPDDSPRKIERAKPPRRRSTTTMLRRGRRRCTPAGHGHESLKPIPPSTSRREPDRRSTKRKTSGYACQAAWWLGSTPARAAVKNAAFDDGGIVVGALVRLRARGAVASGGELTASADRPTFGWAGLTESERGVADLVAEGLTNREVAVRLFLPPNTIDAHLRPRATDLVRSAWQPAPSEPRGGGGD